MKRWFFLALLMGALLGLLGQGMAFAHAMPAGKSEQAAATAQMNADCASKMGLEGQTSQREMPCQDTPDCIAKMGCAMPVAVMPPIMTAAPIEYRAFAPRLAPVVPLAGRDTSPEPQPPTHLG